jgi:1-acyl-sn-glycerol-3-phosphate acyltransferase/nucleoside-diphosphate-sugar epimerase
MARVLVIEPRQRLGRFLGERLRAAPGVTDCTVAADAPPDPAAGAFDVAVVHPRPQRRRRAVPDLTHARDVLRRLAAAPVRRVVLLASTAVYAPHCHNQGLMTEAHWSRRHRLNRVARRWAELEELAREVCAASPGVSLAILRLAPLPVREGDGPLAGLFQAFVTAVVPGYDPSIQLLSPDDLADAVACAVRSDATGTYNVAPAGVIPLRQALRLAGVRRVSVPATVQRPVRAVLAPLGLAHPGDQTDYLCYTWTVSAAAGRDLGYAARRSSAEAVADGRAMDGLPPPRRWPQFAGRRFDDYGFDPAYYARIDRTVARFLEHYYWRVEVRGLEHLPAEGPAVLAGVHRGFMPFDGLIFSHQVARTTGRAPRFLVHPGLVKFPGLHDFMVKQGALIPCNENADYALGRGELLALFPEGIRGAFCLYRDAYRLSRFGRDEFVRMAMRHGAPIVPFVTVGSAEAFPVVGKIEWAWWKRYAEWPYIPVTPTFPLYVPLPSKWHTLVLEPIPVGRDYPPEAAGDEAAVRAVSRLVRRRLEAAMMWMRDRRPSVFYGSVFGPDVVPAEVAAAAIPQGVEA